MPGINIGLEFDDVFGRKAKQKREQEGAVLGQNLLEKGAEPDAVNQIVSKYLKTGEVSYPAYQTKHLPYNPDVPEGTSTRIPFKIGKNKALYAIDQGTGKFSDIQGNPATSVPDGVDPEIRTYNTRERPSKPVVNGSTIYVDASTGDEIRREPNKNGKDEYIRITPPSAKGGSKDTPDVAVAKKVIGTYITKRANGDDLPDDFMDSARSAADRLNITLEEAEKDPTMLDSAQSAVSTATGGFVHKPAKKLGSSAVRFKPGQGKVLTADVVAKYLKRAGGDRAKAKAMAKKDGINW